jgi:hypothetical protein
MKKTNKDQKGNKYISVDNCGDLAVFIQDTIFKQYGFKVKVTYHHDFLKVPIKENL